MNLHFVLFIWFTWWLTGLVVYIDWCKINGTCSIWLSIKFDWFFIFSMIVLGPFLTLIIKYIIGRED